MGVVLGLVGVLAESRPLATAGMPAGVAVGVWLHFSWLRSRQGGLMRRREDGAAALEFALLAPVLFMLLFGIIVFGFLLAQDLALGNSARPARYRRGQQQQRHLRRRRDGGPELGKALGGAPRAWRDGQAWLQLARCHGHRRVRYVHQQAVHGLTAHRQHCDVTLAFDANVTVVPMPGIGSTKHLTGEGVFRCESPDEPPSGERGAVALVVAFCLLGLCICAALVTDLGIAYVKSARLRPPPTWRCSRRARCSPGSRETAPASWAIQP